MPQILSVSKMNSEVYNWRRYVPQFPDHQVELHLIFYFLWTSFKKYRDSVKGKTMVTIKRPVDARDGELRAETKRQSTGGFRGGDKTLYICPLPLKV